MPYIEQKTRQRFDKYIEALDPQSAGELNYLITRLAVQYLKDGVQNYQRHNEIIGVFESAKQEYYRREMVSYEDKKRDLNGDVYA